jgi:hypothetical protein
MVSTLPQAAQRLERERQAAERAQQQQMMQVPSLDYTAEVEGSYEWSLNRDQMSYSACQIGTKCILLVCMMQVPLLD